MSLIKAIKVKGLWGEKDFNFSFAKDYNFFVGKNGCGKTTIMNLIMLSLSGKINQLRKLHFDEIEMSFYAGSKYNKITIFRTEESVSYNFFKKAGDLEKYTVSTRDYFNTRGYEQKIRELLSEAIDITWISVNRDNYIRTSKVDKEEAPSSGIDSSLLSFQRKFIAKMSELSFEERRIKDEFFKNLISLSISLKETRRVGSLDVDIEKIRTSYEDLVRESDNVIPKGLSEKFRDAENCQQKLKESLHNKKTNPEELGRIISSDAFQFLGALARVEPVSQKWKEYLVKKDSLYERSNTFLDVLRSTVVNKEISINNSNAIEYKIKSDGRIINIKDLSSGEKQLLFILGLAFLSDNKEKIFMAYEPELSLHVEWQEQLVRNINKIDDKIQIIFSTHSPDIVSDVGGCIIDMSEE